MKAVTNLLQMQSMQRNEIQDRRSPLLRQRYSVLKSSLPAKRFIKTTERMNEVVTIAGTLLKRTS